MSEATGLPLVWTRLKRLPIDDRNEIPPIEFDSAALLRIPCGDEVHTVRVDGGEFVLEDHDLDAELALLALGAALTPCIVYAHVWREGFADNGFLAKWADDVEGLALQASEEEWHGNYWDSWPADPPPARVLFGPRLQQALAMAVARKWVEVPRADRVAVVQRAVQTRARRAFVASLASVTAHRRPDALVPVGIRIAPGDPMVNGVLSRDASRVELRLPLDWLWAVWDAGDAVVDGRFVVARTQTGLAHVEWTPMRHSVGERLPRIVVEGRSFSP